MFKPKCEALCIVHNQRRDEGRRCTQDGELHSSGFVLCWTHARAQENTGRTYPLVCVKRQHAPKCPALIGSTCVCGEGVLLHASRFT